MFNKPSLQYLVRLWGLFDLCSFAFYVGSNLFYRQIPFYYDILRSIQTARMLGDNTPIFAACIWLPIFLSLMMSGGLLYWYRRSGAIISYIQTPFRLVIFIPPSLFFVLRPLKYIFDKPPIVFGIALVIVSETLKSLTVGIWHKRVRKPYHVAPPDPLE